jgi:CRP/FNR family transcriptional regulator, cyclic AMP receptor protein
MRKVLYILGQLSDEDIEWLLASGSRMDARAGSVLIREGQPVTALYIVLAGSISITVAALGAKEIARLGAGEILGEMSFIDARPPSATATAREDALVFKLDRQQLGAKLAADTAFAARFYHAIAIFLSHRLRNTVSELGYGQTDALAEESASQDELDFAVLDSVHLAGARFERMLQRLISS